jgi:putative ABC transport system permease protein
LLKRPGFTLVAVVTIALGIGANTAIFTVVNALLLRPLPYVNSDRLALLGGSGKDGPSNTGYATFLDWRERSRSFDQMAVIRPGGGTVTGQGEPEIVDGLRVSDGYFRMLGVRPALGRDFKVEEDRPANRFVVLLSYAFWSRRFNSDPNVIGKPVTLSGQPFTVVGVMPKGFEDHLAANFYRPADVWSPLGYDLTQRSACRTCQHLKVVGRLKPDVTPEQASAEMSAIQSGIQREHPSEYARANVTVSRLQGHFTRSIRPALYLLLFAVGLVLLIACANVANLLLARASQRSREVAIRLAIGASRFRILRQSLTESLLLSLAGAGAGLFLALWGTELLVRISPEAILKLQHVKIDARALGFTLLVSLLTAILFGIFPALHAARSDAQHALKESGGRTQGGRSRMRDWLVISEIALALVLLTGAGLLVRSFVRILSVTPGFDQRNLLTLMTQAVGPKYAQESQVRAFYRDVLARVGALPGVESAGVVSNLPFGGNMDMSGFHIEEKPLANPADAPSAERYGISPDYLRAMGIPLLRGRGFTEQDAPDSPLVALITRETAARFWQDENPIGKRIRLGGPEDSPRTIVGVVGDVNHYGLDVAPGLQVYVPHAQWTDSYMRLVVRAAVDPASLAAPAQNAIHAIDPDAPVYQVATMRGLISNSVATRRFTLALLGGFAAVALLMASIGIYGVMSYTVSQRTGEIGVRVALGAQSRDVLKLIVGQGMRAVGAGALVGLSAAAALTRLMGRMLYEVDALDPLTFAVVPSLLILVALLACWAPARRATKVDPLLALRCE